MAQARIILVAAKTRIDSIVVGDRIPVVAEPGLVILQQRRGPKLREAEVTDVVQVIDDALDVAAVAREAIGPIDLVVGIARHDIVLNVAVGEAVGHYQVDRIGGGEAAPVGGTGSTGAQREFAPRHFVAGAQEPDGKVAGAGVRINAQVDEQVVRIVHALGAQQPHSGVVELRRERCHMIAVHQQLQFGMPEADPPAFRFQPLYRGQRACAQCACVQSGRHGRQRPQYSQRHQHPDHRMPRQFMPAAGNNRPCTRPWRPPWR